MTQQERDKFGKNLTKYMGNHINGNKRVNSFIKFEPANSENMTMKLRTKVSPINGKLIVTNLLTTGILTELKDLYTTSGLINKPNGRVIISELSLTQQLFDPTTIKSEYGILCSYRYEYDKGTKKTKLDPLDRY